MTTVDVVALQLSSVPGELEHNRRHYAEAVLRHCKGADLIVTPEVINSGYDLELIGSRGPDLGEPLEGPSVTLTVELARRLQATIVLGLLERAGDTLYDTAAVVTPRGNVTPHRKSHLFPAESSRFGRGERLATVSTPAGRLGPMVCFEHAFPEIATTLATAGAQILVNPSAVACGHEYLLDLRTRARAQDNQLFAVACNLVGHGFFGGSLIADPRGAVLAKADTEEAAVRAVVDLDDIERERQREPALRMRRPELYAKG